jgi:hypothetical protein
VWMGQPWVSNGTQWLSQDGYWTTADMSEGSPAAVGQEAEPPSFAPPADPPPLPVIPPQERWVGGDREGPPS